MSKSTRNQSAQERPSRANDSRRCAIIGLTGGIGSGKSTIARLFAELGARIIDADVIVSELHVKDEVKRKIVTRWGAEMYPSGKLDRAKLAKAVFDDQRQLAELNAILHPLVIERIREELAQCEVSGFTACVIDAALLVEAGLNALCDAVVFVECEYDVRVRRVSDSRGWSEDEISHREAVQMPLEDKKKIADYVVINNGALTTTRKQVKQVAEFLRME